MADSWGEVRKLAADLGRNARTADQAGQMIVAKASLDVARLAKERAPVRTGNLRNSIISANSGLRAVIAPTAGYGVFVELGTRRMAPQPFLFPALDAAEPGFLKAVEQLAGGILD